MNLAMIFKYLFSQLQVLTNLFDKGINFRFFLLYHSPIIIFQLKELLFIFLIIISFHYYFIVAFNFQVYPYLNFS